MKVDPKALYEKLVSDYPDAFVYLVSSVHFGTWIGASPEVLLSMNDGKANTMALAGTLPVDSVENWDDKNVSEQKYVSEFISNVLDENGILEIVKEEVKEKIAGPVKHLVTNFEFEINGGNVLNLVHQLHPTPAVSGLPRKEAMELIDHTEPHKRELYSGFLGVVSNTVANLYVNLRCAQLKEESTCLYVGGGFTKDSQPEMEWDETENKAKTLQNIIENL